MHAGHRAAGGGAMRVIGFAIFLVWFTAFGCGQRPSSTTGERIFEDRLDRHVSLAFEPKRIVSLSPAHTELLFALGAGDRVVGVSAFCNYPADVQTKTNIGGPDPSKLSLETIVSLKPDFVLADSNYQKQAVESLERLRVPVLAYEANSIDEIVRVMTVLNQILGDLPAGKKTVDEFKRDANALAVGRYPNPPTVLYLAGEQPIFAAGGGSFTNELIERAGGKNLFADIKDKYPNVSEEEILRRNPDVIVMARPADPEPKRKELLARPAWQKLKAIQNQRIVFVDEDMASRPGPRILDAIRELEHALHPKTKP
jgi:iron complex transport system substrate-binding protein